MNKVENNVTKGEISHDKQFLLLSQCFQKSSAGDVAKCVCMKEWVKTELKTLLAISPFYTTDVKSPQYQEKVNPFPHIDAFLRLCSRRLSKTW